MNTTVSTASRSSATVAYSELLLMMMPMMPTTVRQTPTIAADPEKKGTFSSAVTSRRYSSSRSTGWSSGPLTR